MKKLIIVLLAIGSNAFANVSIGANGKKFTFTRDTSNSALGEAWKDPSGMIWGDVAKNSDGSIRTMDQIDAKVYCLHANAKTPTNSDYIRLREYMGATPNPDSEIGYKPPGYKPQVLPNLTHRFWTRTRVAHVPELGHIFDGSYGMIDVAEIDLEDKNTVRCVQ